MAENRAQRRLTAILAAEALDIPDGERARIYSVNAVELLKLDQA